MQDELKNLISQAIDSSAKLEQEPIMQFAEGELSDESLESVAGGIICRTRTIPIPCIWRTQIYPKAES